MKQQLKNIFTLLVVWATCCAAYAMQDPLLSDDFETTGLLKPAEKPLLTQEQCELLGLTYEPPSTAGSATPASSRDSSQDRPDESAASSAGSLTPPPNTTVIPMDQELSPETAAFLRVLQAQMDNEWNKKTWAAYLVCACLYGYCGGWRAADYAQLATLNGFPDSFITPLPQETYDSMYKFAFYTQKGIALSGRVLYGSIFQVSDWLTQLSQRYSVSRSFPFVHSSADLDCLEPQQKSYVKWPINLLTLCVSLGLSVVDARMYGKYFAMAIPITLAARDPLASEELAVAGIVDQFDDMHDNISTLWRRFENRGKGDLQTKRSTLRKATEQSARFLQLATADHITEAYTHFKQKLGAGDALSVEAISYLLSLGKDTPAVNRTARTVTVYAAATLLTLLAIYPAWVLGNGVVDENLNVVNDSPTPASAAMGALTVALSSISTFRGVKDFGNQLIDLFAPDTYRRAHNTYQADQYKLVRFLQALHSTAAFTAIALGSAGATALSLYFMLLPDPPGWTDYQTALANDTAGNSTGFTNTTFGNATLSTSGSEAGPQPPTFDAAFYYTQYKWMALTAAYLLATTAGPTAKAISGMREAPIKMYEKATWGYEKIRTLLGYETTENPLSPAAMRDELTDVLTNTGKLLMRVSGSAVEELHQRFIDSEKEIDGVL